MQFELSSLLCSVRYSRGRLTERTRGERAEVREGEDEGGEGERKQAKERENAAPLDFQDIYHHTLIAVFIFNCLPGVLIPHKCANGGHKYKYTDFIILYHYKRTVTIYTKGKWFSAALLIHTHPPSRSFLGLS